MHGLEPCLNDKFLTISAASGYRPQHARVLCRPTVIVNFRLASLPEYGSPAKQLWGSLLAYYTNQLAAQLLYIDAPYNVEGVDDAEAMKESLGNALENIDE